MLKFYNATIELQTFCDSCEKAFAAGSHLRVLGNRGDQVDIVHTKTRTNGSCDGK